MPGRRSNTGAQPTPLEETEPTAPAAPAPEPVPAPEPPAEPDGSYEDPTPPSVEELVDAAFQEAMRKAGRSNPLGFFGWNLPRTSSSAAEEGDYPLTVYEAVAEVTRRVSHIAKDRRTEGGERYNFRGIDDVLAALHPILGDVGLVILPGRMIEHRRETRATAKGGTLNVALPTEASAADDPDVTNEPGRPFTAEEVDRATRAYRAGEQAETVEALAGVRQRALHLLSVPLIGDDGGAAPLAVLFDRRRAELEGVQP
jgi:hypothetical protein